MHQFIRIFGAVRILALILSIYILALNFAPCEDSGGIANDANTEISQNADNGHQHNKADLCSPFCQCCCCQMNAINFDLADISLSPMEISTKLFFHFDSLGKDYRASILQPPQV